MTQQATAKYLETTTPEPIPSTHTSSLTSKGKEQPQSSLAACKQFPILLNVMDQMSSDESAMVRKRLASGFHEICLLLDRDAYRHMRVIWLRLLNDEDAEVFQTFFQSVASTLRVFTRDPNWHRFENDFNQLLNALLKKVQKCMDNPKFKWRQIADLLAQLKPFPTYFDGDLIVSQVVPLLFSVIIDHQSAVVTTSVRAIAIENLCWYSRYLPKLDQRQSIWQMMKENLTDTEHTTYKVRICFLEIIRHLLDMFSAKFFKDQFVMDYLETGKDTVPNVRLKMVELLPSVRKTLKLPMDSQQMQKLNDVVAHLVMQETDRGVSRLLNEIVDNMTSNAREGMNGKTAAAIAAAVASASGIGANGKAPVVGPLSALVSSGSSTASSAAQTTTLGTNTNTAVVAQAKAAWEARDKEKEEEEARMLILESEMEDQRKRRDIDEARQDFTKRLTGNGAAGDKLSLKDKHLRDRSNSTGTSVTMSGVGVGGIGASPLSKDAPGSKEGGPGRPKLVRKGSDRSIAAQVVANKAAANGSTSNSLASFAATPSTGRLGSASGRPRLSSNSSLTESKKSAVAPSTGGNGGGFLKPNASLTAAANQHRWDSDNNTDTKPSTNSANSLNSNGSDSKGSLDKLHVKAAGKSAGIASPGHMTKASLLSNSSNSGSGLSVGSPGSNGGGMSHYTNLLKSGNASWTQGAGSSSGSNSSGNINTSRKTLPSLSTTMSIGGTAGYGGLSSAASGIAGKPLSSASPSGSHSGNIPTTTGTSTLHASFKRVT